MMKPWKRSWLQFLGRTPAARPDRRARALRLLVENLEERTVPSTLTVSNTHASGAGSLRGEILAAHSGDTIKFSSALDGKTISLSGEVLINTDITIQGPGSNKLAVKGASSRLFEIASGATVTIEGLTLENGLAAGSISGGTAQGQGGAVLDHGSLTLTKDVIKSSVAEGAPGAAGQGGGVYVDSAASLTMSGTTLRANSAVGFTNTGQGGALFFASGSTGTLTGDTIKSNTATGGSSLAAQGGGLFADGATLNLSLSTISNNVATGGTGFFASGTAQGGGLFVSGGSVSITQSTIASNAVDGGAGRSGSQGAAGGNGSDGLGGGLFATSGSVGNTINLTADTFYQNGAYGGRGGLGGPSTTTGGVGGTGGNGIGGAVAVQVASGTLTVNLSNDTLATNLALGGVGGTGGTGPAGHGGAGGTGGNGQGGGIWANGGSINLVNDTIAGSSTAIAAKPTAGNRGEGGSGGFASAGNGAQATGGTGQGGGLFESGATVMTLKNTIVANNTASSSDADVSGTFVGNDHNLIGDASGSTGFSGSDLTAVDPHLTALGSYGGPTQTMLPISGPAVDGADDAAAPSNDQRGVARPQGAHTDIGAVEVENLTFTIVSGGGQSARRGAAYKPLVVKLMENGKPVVGVLVDFAVVPGGTGASGKLNHATAATNAKGEVSVTVTANSKAGTFGVTAQVDSVAALTFSLKNR